MQTTYRLENFRSFEDTGPIELAPITVLCGANSSGKSSILKSILLVKQSSVERRSRLVRYAALPPLLFNGEFTRLGSWTDVVNGKDREKPITFQWSVAGLRREIPRTEAPMYRRRRQPPSSAFAFDLRVQFRSSRSTSEELSARLHEATLIHDGSTIDIKAGIPGARAHRCRVSSLGKLTRGSHTFLTNLAYFGMRDIAPVIYGADISFDLGDVIVETEGPFVTGLRPSFNDTWVPFFEKTAAYLQNSRSGMRGAKPRWLTDFESAVRLYKSNPNADISDPEEDESLKLRGLRQFALSILMEINERFDECRLALSPYWKNVRYLGPLRHQPQRFYQFDDTGGVDLGVSGEFTVQVLSLEAHNHLEARGIETGPHGQIGLSSPAKDTLLNLTNYWLAKMGLPSVVPVSARQSLYELSVGELGVALPDVGFGVSQVLPIVVECLRASRGDLVILEQPEIHLHPKIQAVLADFFIARASDGVRIIVESHSEYMIKRFCRRIAESSIPDIDDLINIVFVSHTGSGSAKCDSISLNEYGEIDNWPLGFFDEQEDLYWAQASMARRRGKERPKLAPTRDL
jgi:predicted ATPase